MPKADRVLSTPPTNTSPLSPAEHIERNPQTSGSARSTAKQAFPKPSSPASAPGASSACQAAVIPDRGTGGL
jgi:hypothetical protein